MENWRITAFGNHASRKIMAPVASEGRSLMKKLASSDAYQLEKILTAVLSPRPLDKEEKIRIVLDGLRGESSIAELCRREDAGHARHPAGHVLPVV